MEYKNVYILLICVGVIGIIYYFFPNGLQLNGSNGGNNAIYSTGTLDIQDTDQVWGCMDIMADNYNSTVTIDDGSCLTAGCTDINATNYNSYANYDPNDNLCNYGGGVGGFVVGVVL